MGGRRWTIPGAMVAVATALASSCGGGASTGTPEGGADATPPAAQEGGQGDDGALADGDATSDGATGDEGPHGMEGSAGGCTSDADCVSPLMCTYLVADRCAATGMCRARPAAICNLVLPPSCGCDGSPVPVLCGSPTAPRPVRSPGPCTD